MKIAYLGDEYTHTYAAAKRFAQSEGATQLRGYDDVAAVLAAVKSGECDCAAAPIENSYEGTVAATVDGLRESGLYIISEYVAPIEQNLIALSGTALTDIATVYSHPQALAQCRRSLKELLPNASAVAVAYTSAGLNMLGCDSAAIARAPKSGQAVIKAHIEDSGDNCTRFILASSSSRGRGSKVSVSFSTPNNPGALLKALIKLSERGCNMTKIESRPAKKLMGQYVFNVDFIFAQPQTELNGLMRELGEVSCDLRYLGRYDVII